MIENSHAFIFTILIHTAQISIDDSLYTDLILGSNLSVLCGEFTSDIQYSWTGPNNIDFGDHALMLSRPLTTADNSTNYTCNVLLTNNPTKCPVQNRTITLHIRGNSSVAHVQI